MELLECLLKGFYTDYSLAWQPHQIQTIKDGYFIRLKLHPNSTNQDEDLVLQHIHKSVVRKDGVFQQPPDVIAFIQKDSTCVFVCEVCFFDSQWYIYSLSNSDKVLTCKNIICDFLLHCKYSTHIHYVSETRKIQSWSSSSSLTSITLVPRTISNLQKPIAFTKDKQFFVATSCIPGAGFGLFANVLFPRGALLLIFKGKKIPQEDFNEEDSVASEYAMLGEQYDSRKFVFDPTDKNGAFHLNQAEKQNNFAPFINEPPPNTIANAESVSMSSEKLPLFLQIVATRCIHPQEEIYMCYNRSSAYLTGFACPKPISCFSSTATTTTTSSHIHKRMFFAVGLSPTHNLDHARIKCLSTHYFVKCISPRTFDCLREEEEPKESVEHTVSSSPFISDLLAALKVDSEEKTRVKDRIIYFDYIHCMLNTHVVKMLFDIHFEEIFSQSHTSYVLLPYIKCVHDFLISHTHIGRKMKINFLFLTETIKYLPWLPHKCYYFDLLDNTFPFLMISYCSTATTIQLPTWTIQRIVKDYHLSDKETLEWLQRYSSQEERHHVCVPFVKHMSLEFCNKH